jgi:hypothetical protein
MDTIKRATRPLESFSDRNIGINAANIEPDLKRSQRHRSELKGTPQNMKLAPEQFPDPWLFDSEKLLNTLDRIRESALRIPINNDKHAVHFAVNAHVSMIWDLRETLNYLLTLHKAGQRAFSEQSRAILRPKPTTNKRSAIAALP